MKYKLTTKTKLLKAFLLVSVFLITSCSTDETQKVTNFTELVMADEFDKDGAPNPDLWSFDIGTGENGWGNNELQYYTNRTENVNIENGVLLISARNESFNGSSYTSARLITKGKFEQAYGRFEARMRLPFGQGIWPAFWLLGSDIDEVGWPQTGEIDIMEYRGQQPTVNNGTVHGPGYSAGNSITKSYALVNNRFDTDFHIFGIEWAPDYINFYVDDVLYNQITPADVTGEWVFNKPFFILINLAVGGNFVGSPNAETVFPQTLLIDYVRVYKNNNNVLN
ncbi:MAG: glycoside hydrolase family 16 protein [Flavobacteriales bacterium]|nr:glycoside hydrolase family 16 protein [Flavobacteriia bacterium]NCP89636.1 glycoside hydrolase family 16 protein [Flavobacteriales bacterium]PIV94654.1 MAG: glycosyl hydrolase family 16 [Flavobacteriaceae bacterium CG17_big_fil_post_rev_8_21_14_2_50_33_15]PIY13256.1 MAG: glycosyl hydrolase family 16 [Flavobacteriaceae bacterium CG_4_10_14_3_um_filter_33_47]PJB16815.1 MAG: glycosyl hydrolase family 16 [Flavobacteriaceae bacterium CG_4_9_14_3_um_filter_33_16]